MENSKKRKRGDNYGIAKKYDVKALRPIPYLLCDICQSKVCEYHKCVSPYIYCSLDCFELIYLTYFGSFGGTKASFEEDDPMLL